MSSQLLSLFGAASIGLIITRLFRRKDIPFPDSCVFLLAGVLISPFFLRLFGFERLSPQADFFRFPFSVIFLLTLGFSAYTAGLALRQSLDSRGGRQAAGISLLSSLMAALLADGALIALHFCFGEELMPMSAAVILGAVAASATPPALILLLGRTRARGSLSELLLPCAALSNLVSLIFFAFSLGIAQSIENEHLSLFVVLLNPITELLFSGLLGLLMSTLLVLLTRRLAARTSRFAVTIGFILLTAALSDFRLPFASFAIAFSPGIACVTLGAMQAHLGSDASELFPLVMQWTLPLYAVFFLLTGSMMDLAMLGNPCIFLCALTFTLGRCAGKYLGGRLAGSALGCSKTVTNRIGLMLFTQAGLPIGMAGSASVLGRPERRLVYSVTFFSILVCELAGPILTQRFLRASGEIPSGSAGRQKTG